ncbi:hypothetical protein GCM10025864_14910 [Luteimicrobium album]|uniref:Uncharacterized protein n=1 Tax=Luteimicrobium album TaxID=1054550 RepID=A0ABQ6I0G5_9MICO|nr:hypothetical protein GCM10025864_14910 [Luteimicrobium album]
MPVTQGQPATTRANKDEPDDRREAHRSPAITPQSPAPRPDLPSVQGPIAVPPPPPSAVATDDRTHERYQGCAVGRLGPDERQRDRVGDLDDRRDAQGRQEGDVGRDR